MDAALSRLSAIRREFLGWDRPALPEAARRLATRYRQGQTLDLGQVIVVVPGKRAGRRLQELLAFQAEDEELRLTPPQVVTEGTLPEKLYTPKLPFASDLVQDLAWAQALRELPVDELQRIVPHPPAPSDTLRWVELGKVLRELHCELAADGLDFAAVRENGSSVAGFNEAQRWEALVAVQARYLELLDKQKLWDIQTARLKAIQFRELRTDGDLILLGTVDLNNTLRQMLDQVAQRVTAYIVAPEILADHFDAHGCLVPDTWCQAMVPLRDEQLYQVDGPVEQTDAVSGWLEELQGRFGNDEVAIGVPDESLVPQLQRQLEQSGVRGRWVDGVRLGETGPYRLLAAAVKFAGRRRYDDVAALLRHPDLEDWLQGVTERGSGHSGRGSLLAQLDQYYNKHLPSRIRTSTLQQPASGGSKPPEGQELTSALERIETWLDEASANHSLRTWGNVFRRVLAAVYAGRTLDLDTPADDILDRTIRRILDECDQLDSVPEALDTVSFSAADAFQIALAALASQALPPPADPGAVEILGWLELPLDDSLALVVTSFNEGFVPKSTGAEAFLPDRLRRELGLLHNERRYARDAYAASVLCHSRQELRVLLARQDTNKDPLRPSRLIFACPDDTLICRARRFFAEPSSPTVPRRLLLAPGGPIPEESRFEPPRPVPPEEKPQRISVTRFKVYLACRYRYYLRHVRNLEAVNDAARELDGSAFGNLLHGTLSAFGRDTGAPRLSTREQEVFEFLDDRLQAIVRGRYGADERRASIRLQVEQARRRLKAFAAKQVALVREGWRIVHAEQADETRNNLCAAFAVDGEPITLVGRIDRIDFQETTRTLCILDYKTADSAQTPDKTHRSEGDWIDLQLPLYRHLWRATPLDVVGDCTIKLGYFNLPKQLDKTGVDCADWDEATLESADDRARQVVRDLRHACFWPPVHPPPDFSEDLAAICLDNVLHGPVLPDEEQGGWE
jgi:hypothetical protein